MKSNLPSFSFILQFVVKIIVLICLSEHIKGCDSKGMYVYDFDSDGDFNFKMFLKTP
jgi:hypothetical protein